MNDTSTIALTCEVLDRAWVQLDVFEKMVYNHPAIQTDKKLKKLAKKAFNKQWKLYQKLGEKCFECKE